MALIWVATGGLAGTVLEAARHPEGGPGGALAAGLTWALGTVVVLALLDAALGTVGRPWRLPLWPAALVRLSGETVAVGGAGLVILALARTPHRMVANLIGYSVLVVIALWLGRHRGGDAGARAAGLAVAIFGLVPSHANVTTPPPLPAGAAGSPYIWSAGWPSAAWVLRHEIELLRPLERPHLLILALERAAPARGAEVHVRLNGAEAGALQPAPYDRLELLIPAERLAGQRRLTLELRMPAPSGAVRVLAHRWTGGASLGRAASAYFDGATWHAGTYDDAAGVARQGVYTVELEPR